MIDQLVALQIWAIDLDTRDYQFTQMVTKYLNACPADGAWLPTAPGEQDSLACDTLRPGAAAGATMTRRCKEDATWDVIDNSACLGASFSNLAAKQCIN